MSRIPINLIQPTEFVNEGVARQIERVLAESPPMTVPVMEVFRTYEGEGLKIGTPRVLARVAGCPVGCEWCDSVHTWAAKGFPMLSPEQFAARIIEVAAGKVREVSITGGEPMMYPRYMIELSMLLQRAGFRTSIETSGVIISAEVFDHFNMVSLDIKTPSSGVPLSQSLIDGIIRTAYTHPHCQVKAVVTDQRDLDFLYNKFGDLLVPTRYQMRPLVLTPCADNTKQDVHIRAISAVCDMIQEWNQAYNIAVIIQQHKLFNMDPVFVHERTGKELPTYHIVNGASDA